MLHLNIGKLILQDVRDLRPEEACLKAVTHILDAPHHVYFIEMRQVETAHGGSEQIAVHDPYGRLADVQRLNENRLVTVKVPGFQGEYAMVIFPFGD